MPVSSGQLAVLRLLAQNRSTSAYLAGGLISARDNDRFSSDIDYFHDSGEITRLSFESDRALLQRDGYTVDVEHDGGSFIRARVTKGDFRLKVDWAQEASWHFFKPVADTETGVQLHWADAATNKVLAMASRSEIRDAFDALYWHRNPLSLGALIWAAAGKDAGLTPGIILEEMRRNARISPHELAMLQTISPIEPTEFGTRFRQALREAESLILSLPPDTLGNLFLDEDGNVIEPDPEDPASMSRPLAASQGGLVAQVLDSPGPGF